MWAPPGHGRGPGYYCCFRIYHPQGETLFALLFCFYDGTEGSPGFKQVWSELADRLERRPPSGAWAMPFSRACADKAGFRIGS